MAAILCDGFSAFAQYTGILGEIRRYQAAGPWVLLALGLLMLFAGFRTFRVLFGALVFVTVTTAIVAMLRVKVVLTFLPGPMVIVLIMLMVMLLSLIAYKLGFGSFRVFFGLLAFLAVALAIVVMLREKPDWGSVTTCFAIVATVLSFLAFFWYRFGACTMCVLIGAAFGWTLFRSPWAAGVLAALGLVLTLTFPVISLSVGTSAFGTWLLWDAAAMVGTVLPVVTPLALAALGLAVQLLFSRRQTLFKKTMPDRVTHYLEERKRARQYADGLSQGN